MVNPLLRAVQDLDVCVNVNIGIKVKKIGMSRFDAENLNHTHMSPCLSAYK